MKITKEQKQQVDKMIERFKTINTEREMAINAKTNFGTLENFVQKINSNPKLVVEITTIDGTKIVLKTMAEKKFTDNINGDYLEVN